MNFLGILARQRPRYLRLLIDKPFYKENFTLSYRTSRKVYEGTLLFSSEHTDDSHSYQSVILLDSIYNGPSYREQFDYTFLPRDPPLIIVNGVWRSDKRRISPNAIPLHVFELFSDYFHP